MKTKVYVHTVVTIETCVFKPLENSTKLNSV